MKTPNKVSKAAMPPRNLIKRVEPSKRFIVKSDDERFVIGVVYEPNTPDAHGDWISPEPLRKAAHEFMGEFQSLNVMHEAPLGKQSYRLAESYIAKTDEYIGQQRIKAGSWVLAAYILDDELWGAIKSGSLVGWSLEGYAQWVDEPKKFRAPPEDSLSDARAWGDPGGDSAALSVSFVRNLCKSCAERMEKLGLTTIRADRFCEYLHQSCATKTQGAGE